MVIINRGILVLRNSALGLYEDKWPHLLKVELENSWFPR